MFCVEAINRLACFRQVQEAFAAGDAGEVEMPSGILSNVQLLETEVLALKERCTRLEAECEDLRKQMREMEASNRSYERAYHALQEDVRAQMAAILQEVRLADGDSMSKGKGVQFRRGDSVLEIEDKAGGGSPGRRKRVPTAFPPQIGGAGQGARIGGDVEEVEPEDADGTGQGGELRSARGRQPTAFAPKQGTRIRGDVEEVEPDDSDGTGQGGELRSARGRQPTAFAPKQAVPDAEHDEDGRHVVIQAGAGSGTSPGARKRIPTAFPRAVDLEDEDEDERSGSKQVVFRERDSVMEVPNRKGTDMSQPEEDEEPEAPSSGSRSPKRRVATGFISDRDPRLRKLSRGVSFADATSTDDKEKGEPQGDEDDAQPELRPVRARIPTACAPRIKMNDEEEEEPLDDEDRPVKLRPTRTRLPTACPKDEGGHPSLEDPMSKRENSAPSMPSSPVAPEAHVEPPDIERHRKPQGVKDEDLIRSTLQSLYFFRELDEGSISALVGGMEVFAFEDGADVTRQGNAHGTHFFIVAAGEFDVSRNGEVVAVIARGAAFGESVILLSGRQNATVRAKGDALAYGMSGTAVRTLLKERYQGERKEVINGINAVLGSGKCHLFHKLTPWQTQLLYDKAEMSHSARGEILHKEGGKPCSCVRVVVHGGLSIKVHGAEVQKVEQFGVAGEMDMLFKEARYGMEALSATQSVSLSRALLKEMFAERLEETLLRSRLLDSLSRRKAFSQLGIEQLDAVVDLAKHIEVPPGESVEQKGVRMAVCLRGQVDASATGASPDDPSVPQAQTLVGAAGQTFGEPELLKSHCDWTLLAKGAGALPSKLAVWTDESLDRVLKIGPLRRGMSQMEDQADEDLSPRSAASTERFTRSPSMKICVFQQDKVGALRKVFVFRSLAHEQLFQLAQKLEVRYVEKNEKVFSEGDHANDFFIIFDGMVEIDIGGKKIRTLGMGDYVGERALLFSEPRSATVTAVEDSELWKMEAEAFHSVVRGPILDYMKDRIAFQNTRVGLESLACVRVIGRGGFGVVKMVVAKEGSIKGTRYALKCVSKKLAVEQKQQKALANERNILAELDHPFIIKFVRSFHGSRYVYFLMELVTGGELLDALDVLGLLKRSQAQFYVGSITLALEFLHERRIAYLDLKGENCLIDNHGYLKMVDFGIAERVKNGRIYAVKGTPLFMAPEVILGKGYTTTADLWGLGVCLYDFMLGKFPFSDDSASKTEVFRAVLKAPLAFPKWLNKDPDTRSLLEGLLSRDPNKRPGAGPNGYAEMKEHPWFQDFSWDGLLSRQLTPPFLPKGETYAEDQEEGKGRIKTENQMASVAEDEQGSAQDADWVDPDPSWADHF